MRPRDAINSARDLHPAFDKRSTPDVVALRHLALYQQDLLAKIAETKLDRLHVSQTIPLPLAHFDDGAQIDPYLRVHGGKVLWNTTTFPTLQPAPLEIVEYPLRLDYVLDTSKPAAYIEAGVLKLLGVAQDWTDFATIVLDLFPQGPEVIGIDDQMLLPGSPMRACVASLGLFMGGRAIPPVTPAVDAGAQDSYIDEVTERRRAVVGTIRETW